MKKQYKLIVLACIFILGNVEYSIAADVAAGPTIDKTSILIRARRRTGSYEEIEKRGYAIWGWTPEVNFRVNGPLSSGAQLFVEIKKPGGASWVKFDCKSGAAPADGWWEVSDCGDGLKEEQLAREVGLYDFTIGVRDELAGSNQVLFTGKLKVNKFFAGGVEPKSEQHFGYYVDYDWYLPVGQVYPQDPVDTYGNTDQEFAPLVVSLWFRGDVGNEVSAHLFYNGQEISNTKESGKGTSLGEKLMATFDDSKFIWRKTKFFFTNALVFNHEDPNNHPNAFRMDKNPGEYTVKVLRKGSLTRVLAFTVDKNGKIVDPGIGSKNSLGNNRIIVPVSVTGDEDGATWDKEAWKTLAFFSNPLSGFDVR